MYVIFYTFHNILLNYIVRRKCLIVFNKEYVDINGHIFTDVLAKITMLSKQNQKSESEPTVRKRQTATKEATYTQTSIEYSKEQLEYVKRYTYKIRIRIFLLLIK